MSISIDVRNQWSKGYGPRYGVRIGTAGVGVKADHYTADGHNIVTRLTVNGVMPAVTGSIAVGLKVFTFPAGTHALKLARLNIALQQADGLVTADTPKIGLGDIIGVGAIVNLTSVAGFDNILTEQTADDCDGTKEDKTILVPTAGHLVNESAGLKAVWINVADGWAGAEAALGVVGEVWLEWTRLTSA